MLVRNFLSLVFFLHVVLWAMLAACLPYYSLTNHPNVAVLYFPFIWMTCFIIPLICFHMEQPFEFFFILNQLILL